MVFHTSRPLAATIFELDELKLGTNVVEDIVSFDLIPHTSIYEAKWLRKFKNIVLAARVGRQTVSATRSTRAPHRRPWLLERYF